MNFYYMIRNLSNEQIKELLSLKIDELKYYASAYKERFIGIDCDINPLLEMGGEQKLNSQAIWQGFIPEDVKIIYSFLPNKNGFTTNNGCYYYIDNHDYLYEFALYIKEQEIKDSLDFLKHVYTFIDDYFFSLDTYNKTRMEMHQPFLNSNGRYITPSTGHHLSDFKGKNNAKCSEYSAIAENILSVFGYKTIYLGGAVNTKYGSGGHAFNLAVIDNIPCILDFTIPVETYDFQGKIIEISPFLGVITDFNQETLHNHIYDYIPYEFDDYEYLVIGDTTIMINNNSTRSYIAGKVEYYNQKIKKLSKK